MALKNYVTELKNSNAFELIDALSKEEANFLCKIASISSKINYTKEEKDSRRRLKIFTMTFNANGNKIFRDYSNKVIELLA